MLRCPRGQERSGAWLRCVIAGSVVVYMQDDKSHKVCSTFSLPLVPFEEVPLFIPECCPTDLDGDTTQNHYQVEVPSTACCVFTSSHFDLDSSHDNQESVGSMALSFSNLSHGFMFAVGS
jgi:hypothetical protein